MRTTNIKFTGLASGLDTEALVKSMVMPYKNKVDTSQQNKQLLELKKQAYKDMNNKIFNFYNKTLNNLRLESTFNKTNVTVSNPNAIKIDSNASIPEGNHTIEVISVATGATVSTNNITKADGTKVDKGTKISELNNNLTGSYKIEVGGGAQPISITGDTTIEEIESELKKSLGDSSVSFDTKLSAFIISTPGTGENQKIDLQIKNIDDSINTDLESALGIKSGLYTGTSAEIKYNGGITIKSETNNIEVNGLKFTVTGMTTQPVTISAVTDTASIVDAVKTFVDEYNTLIDEMNKMVDAEYNKTYKPLTAEQKKEMTEDEIALWEKKINDSILRKDPVLSELTSTMRSILGDVVKGNGLEVLSDIGIETGMWNEKGKLYLDEDKLKKAINEDSQAVIKLFSSNGDETKAKDLYISNGGTDWNSLNFEQKNEWLEKTGTVGFADRIYNRISKMLKGTNDKSSNFLFNDKLLDKQIRQEDESLKKLEEKMYKMEDMYYKKFAAMEKAMSMLNNQSSWLMNQ